MRIFILEDELLLGMHLEDELTDEGHQVVGPAGTIEDAESMIAENALDFALLDTNINGRSSAKIAEQLVDKNVPFAYLSGYDESYIRANLPDAPILSKPLDKAKLKTLLDEMVS